MAESYSFSIFSIVFLLCGLFSLGTGIITWKIRKEYNFYFLSLMAFTISWWAFSSIFEAAGTGVFEKYLWSKISYPGIVATPVFYFLYAMEYGQFKKWKTRKYLVSIFIFPVLIIAAAASNDFHHLIWTGIDIDPVSNIGLYGHGFLFWIFIGYTYSLLMGGVIIYIVVIFRFSYYYRSQTVMLILGTLLPIVGNLIYLSDFNPVRGVDWTPIGLSITAALLAVGISGFKFLVRQIPVPRNDLIEMIEEGVVFIDGLDRVIDVNDAACRIFGLKKNVCYGRNIDEIFPEWVKIKDRRVRDSDRLRTELFVEGDSPVFLDIRINHLNGTGTGSDKLMLISDITSHKRIQIELKQLNERLKTELTENEALQRNLKKQIIIDPLTGAYNRRYLSEAVEKDLKTADDAGYSIGFMMIDIDHFKNFNDTYGHQAGDYILESLVNRMMGRIREEDVICRYGGEEFLLLLPNIDSKTLFKKADGWRKDIAAETLEFENKLLSVTISVGIAMYPDNGDTFQAAVKAADYAMYLAKASGRNRTVVAEK